jgi:hypothetical protein
MKESVPRPPARTGQNWAGRSIYQVCGESGYADTGEQGAVSPRTRQIPARATVFDGFYAAQKVFDAFFPVPLKH